MLSQETSTDTKVEWNNGDKIETTTTVVVQEFADKVTTTTTVEKITHKAGGGKTTSTRRMRTTKGKTANDEGLVALFDPSNKINLVMQF